MCRKLRNASATSLGSSQYKLMAALSTATPLANSSKATLRSACSRARCSALAWTRLISSEVIGGSLGRVADIGSKLFYDFLGCALGSLVFAHVKGNGPNSRVSAATIAFTDLGQVYSWRRRCPRV